MTFELVRILDVMIELYEKPRTFERFQEYLQILLGTTKDELVTPIVSFNPMAKEHILEKLQELKKLNAEQIIEEAFNESNFRDFATTSEKNFKVAINLSDDLKGGWTNRFTSDYDSKFRFNGIFTRGFCVPIFWSSESFTKDMIRQRTLEYVYRTIYWISKPEPVTLKEHLAQEAFVASQVRSVAEIPESNFQDLIQFYEDHQNSDNYHIIFNFFYGDQASKSLGFPCYGISEKITGFSYPKKISTNE